jgi:uncharacterized membrane protein YoaT (DUF817 family)
MEEREVFEASRWRPRRLARFAYHFTLVELQSLVFAIAIFAALAASAVVPLPIARYDALLIFGIALTLGLWWAGWETGREVLVVFAFHLVGLALELFKVHEGSWSYPEDAFTKVGGVPLYAGFMYAAVGSYIVQAWRRMHLRVTDFRLVTMAILAALAYANFFTHHWIPDLRWVIAAAFVVALWGTMVHFTVGGHRYRMPLVLSFVAIGLALWFAENAATFLGAWKYPDQLEVWRSVHVGKVGSWSLLVSLSFVLVAILKYVEGGLYGQPGDERAVEPHHRDDGPRD